MKNGQGLKGGNANEHDVKLGARDVHGMLYKMGIKYEILRYKIKTRHESGEQIQKTKVQVEVKNFKS